MAEPQAPSLQAAQQEAVQFTAELIRIDTTNAGGGEGRERLAAEHVAGLLAEAGIEPVLLESAPGRANVVARIAGRSPSAGGLLMHGHLDVVPADPADWSVHPFSGEIRDGSVWGRGAIDMKNSVAVLVAIARHWARTGQQPPRDVVLAFTADEEDTAQYGATWLVDQHRDLLAGCTEAVGESGGFTFHAGGGLRIYPIASAERGTAWLRLTSRGQAGHGSKPNSANAVARLAAAMTRISDYRWPVRLTPTVSAAIEAIREAVAAGSGETPGPANSADPLAGLGPAAVLVKGTVRNSAAPTMLNAGYKVNVIPAEATGYVDGRVLPGYDAEFRAAMDELTGADVEWDYYHSEIPLEAPWDCDLVGAMCAAVEQVDPGAVCVPYCMTGGTDAKQFARLGMNCYGFTPLVLPPGYDYYANFHGTDEHVPVAALEAAVTATDWLLRASG